MKIKQKITLCLCLSGLLITSCNDNLDDNVVIKSGQLEEFRVLKERDSNTPWIPSDYQRKNVTKSAPVLSHNAFLGYSIKNSTLPIEDTRNIGHQVIDIAKIQKDQPSYFQAWKNTGGEATFFSYSSFERYTSNSTIKNSVSTGANVNLGLFSFGNKNNIKSIFTNTFAEDKNTVFGELNVIIRDSCYRMQYSSNIQQKIKEQYLTENFKDELYNTHPSEFLTNYGGFVLTDYVVGGKATALYAGTYKKTESSETKEHNMNTEISASYSFVSANLSVGRDKQSGTSVTNEFSSIMMSLKTIGGNSSFAAFSIPKEVKNTGVDLSNWVTSLNDKTTHSVVEFAQSGLIPITDFVVESNLKSQIEEYYTTGITNIERLSEPWISISYTRVNYPQLIVIGTYLHNRFGHSILLKNQFLIPTTPNINDIPARIEKYVNDETNRVSSMFGVRIVNYIRSRVATEQPKTYFDFDAFNEKYLTKVIHNGVIYIVSDYTVTNPNMYGYGKRYALSIHNTRYLDEYVMRGLVDRLPTTNISYETLIRDYDIQAL